MQFCLDNDNYTRECYIGIFLFIPAYAKDKFDTYLDKVFPVLRENLNHESDDVRAVTIRVLQIII